jgi:hypothetical protein
MAKQISRQEFYDAVIKRSFTQCCSVAQAYEEMEQIYLKRHGERRYMNFATFYHSNYIVAARANQKRVKDAMIKDKLYELCEAKANNDLNPVEFVQEVLKVVKEKS